MKNEKRIPMTVYNSQRGLVAPIEGSHEPRLTLGSTDHNAYAWSEFGTEDLFGPKFNSKVG